MSDSIYFRCWVVACKTQSCKFPLFLDVIGLRNRSLHAVVPPCLGFKITCQECRVEYLYSQSDLEEHNLENPPSDYRCTEFREAVGLASLPIGKQGTEHQSQQI
jgi:hypothetical protein